VKRFSDRSSVRISVSEQKRLPEKFPRSFVASFIGVTFSITQRVKFVTRTLFAWELTWAGFKYSISDVFGQRRQDDRRRLKQN
jgi:hypothetical protein